MAAPRSNDQITIAVGQVIELRKKPIRRETAGDAQYGDNHQAVCWAFDYATGEIENRANKPLRKWVNYWKADLGLTEDATAAEQSIGKRRNDGDGDQERENNRHGESHGDVPK